MLKPPIQNLRATPARKAQRRLSLTVLIAGCIGFALATACHSRESTSPPMSQVQNLQPQPLGMELSPTFGQDRRTDFSKFSHKSSAHSRLPCLQCHRREGNSTEVNRPGHRSCAGCHFQQFNDASSPVCAICHTDAPSGKAKIKRLPPLKSFTVVFDHAKHTKARCSTCHRPAKSGVALSIPSGSSAHATCFQCHGPRAEADGRDISSCGVCHQEGNYIRPAVWTRAYKVSFSHASHGAGERLSCAECHSVRAGLHNEVSSPAVSEHFATRGLSCRSCHNNKRAFGEEFASCKRCHRGQTFRF
jgi:c(7)-type cytochrome triheme protein